MSFANYAWKLKENVDEKLVSSLSSESGVSKNLVRLCVERGVKTVEDLQEFLSPTPHLIHDPFLLHDMDKAVGRIQEAIENGELIHIYGDYDADGITSTTILYETLEMLGAQVSYYLPNRFTDGYGPNIPAFQRALEEGHTLIITVDCGIASHEPIRYAMENGCDVILTDHHEIPSEIPEAYAVVHPRYPEANYPCGDLSGAGVAFKLAHALLGEFPEEMVELAAIGTIADLVSLTDENRTIAKLGIAQMKQTQRIGLVSLLEKLSVKMDKLDEKTVGFQIGPRLNALGRLGDATPGVQLLTTFDDEEAANIVDFMQSENERRQAIVNQIVEEATPLIEAQISQPILVLAQPGWHEGVLGIVASRIVEQTGKPTIVLGISEDGLTAKGSGRSFGEFNLYDALTSVKEHLLKFGGHHMAAGLTVETILLPTIIEGLEQYAKDHQDLLDAKATLTIDEVLPLKEITVEWIDSLANLKPFGTDNPEPVVSLEGILVASTQLLGADKQHLKLNLKESNFSNTLQAMAFSKGEWAQSLQPDTKISIAGTLEINEWQNNRLPQLMVKDIAVEGRVVIDWRTSKITKDHLNVENAIYLATNETYLKELETRIPSTSSVMDFSTFVASEGKSNAKAIVLFDLPEKVEEVEAFFKMDWAQPLYVIAYTKNSVVTTGIPDKPKFGLVYKYIQSHRQIPYNEKLVSVAGFLKIPVEQFRIILKVFFELEFVKIVNGHLMINLSPKTNDLEESTLLKKLNEQMLLEKKFNYSQFQELKSWIDSQQGK